MSDAHVRSPGFKDRTPKIFLINLLNSSVLHCVERPYYSPWFSTMDPRGQSNRTEHVISEHCDKMEIEQLEGIPGDQHDQKGDNGVSEEALGTNLPKSYWYSPGFIGTIIVSIPKKLEHSHSATSIIFPPGILSWKQCIFRWVGVPTDDSIADQ